MRGHGALVGRIRPGAAARSPAANVRRSATAVSSTVTRDRSPVEHIEGGQVGRVEVVVDLRRRVVTWLELLDGGYRPVKRSALLGLDAAALAPALAET